MGDVHQTWHMHTQNSYNVVELLCQTTLTVADSYYECRQINQDVLQPLFLSLHSIKNLL